MQRDISSNDLPYVTVNELPEGFDVHGEIVVNTSSIINRDGEATKFNVDRQDGCSNSDHTVEDKPYSTMQIVEYTAWQSDVSEFDAKDSDFELYFDPPEFLEISVPPVSVQHTLCSRLSKDRALYFRGNYRRFLILLFLGTMVTSSLYYWLALQLALSHPLRITLFLATVIWAVACGIYYVGSYRKRSIALDYFGIYYQDELREICITWREIESIHLHAVEAFFNPYPLCYVKVVTSKKDEFAFANFGTYLYGIQRNVSFGSPPYPIIDVRDSDLLLALMVQQSSHAQKTPDLARLRYRAQSELDAANDVALAMKKNNDTNKPTYVGLWALFAKIGLKWLPQGMGLLMKTVKPGYIGASVGLYAIIFQWQFAVILVMLLLVHELGHVWAMYRSGMRIRGVYLIPFFGAATVTDDTWPSWSSMARVSLAGPLWGTYFTAICLVMFIIFPGPFWLIATVVGALLNLVNLLPIQPLDGGRILNAMAFSLRSFLGFFLILGFLAIGIMLGLYFELLLIYILSLIGVAEFFREYMSRLRAEKLLHLQARQQITARDVLLLKSITGINFGLNSSPHALEHEKNQLRRLRMLLNAPPMTRNQMLVTGFATFAVAMSLMAFLILAQHIHPHTKWAIDLFR